MNVHRNLLEMFIAICFYCLQTSDKNVFVNQEDEDGFSGRSGSRRKWEQELSNSGSDSNSGSGSRSLYQEQEQEQKTQQRER